MLARWMDTASLLKDRGRLFLIFAAPQFAGLAVLLRDGRLEPKRARFVHPGPGKSASLVLIEAVKSAAPGIEMLPPLFLHATDGGLSSEMLALYANRH